MRIGDTITLTQKQFLKLAPLGLQVSSLYDMSTVYMYLSPSKLHVNINDYPNYIPGYIYCQHLVSPYIPINGLWSYFNGVHEFRVIQPPQFRISKTKEFT